MSKEEKEVLYQCYLESGLSPKEFAERNNVKSAVIRGLISFHKRLASGERSSFFQVVTKEDQPILKEKEIKVSQLISFKLDGHLIEIDKDILSYFLRCLS